MTVTIRKLTRRDRVTLTNLIKKFVSISGTESLVNMAPSPKGSEEPEGGAPGSESSGGTAEILESAFGLLEQMLDVIEADVTDWFQSLIGVAEREEYDSLGFDIETEVIEQILEQKGFVDFFSRGSRVVKKIRALVDPSES